MNRLSLWLLLGCLSSCGAELAPNQKVKVSMVDVGTFAIENKLTCSGNDSAQGPHSPFCDKELRPSGNWAADRVANVRFAASSDEENAPLLDLWIWTKQDPPGAQMRLRYGGEDRDQVVLSSSGTIELEKLDDPCKEDGVRGRLDISFEDGVRMMGTFATRPSGIDC